MESGFFQVEPRAVRSPSFEGDNVPARLWYAFQSADENPQDKPLVVVFNGGPGAATSSILFGMGISKHRLLLDSTQGPSVVANEGSWTRFANLLFVDARQTGFSYSLRSPGESPQDKWDPYLDAADFAALLVAFYGRYPWLADNRLVVVGESYGGVRMNVLTSMLLRPAALSEPDAAHYDPGLGSAIGGLLRAAGLDPEDQAAIGARFANQVHIQTTFAIVELFTLYDTYLTEPGTRYCAAWEGTPFVSDDCRRDAPGCTVQSCLSANRADDFDIRQAAESLTSASEAAGLALQNVDIYRELTGLSPQDIGWFLPAARAGAFRTPGVAAMAADGDGSMLRVLGSLGSGDGYFISFNSQLLTNNPEGFEVLSDNESSKFSYAAFEANLPYANVMMTDAVFDAAVLTALVPRVLDGSDAVSNLDVVDETDPRRRAIEFDLTSTRGNASRQRIYFPQYEAGHAVALTAGETFASDVEMWLSER